MRRAALFAILAASSCDRVVDDGAPRLALADAEAVFFTEFCLRQTDCCSPFDIPSAAQCDATLDARILSMTAVAQDKELTYDPSCWGAEIEHLRERDCDPDPPDEGQCVPSCRPWHGGQQVGEYCFAYEFALTNCARGLVCAPGFCEAGDCPDVCQDPCARSELGEPCLGVPCIDGLLCDVAMDECVRAPALGEPCVWGSGCSEGAMCDDATDECVAEVVEPPAGAPGSPCTGHAQCESNSCPAGYCTDLPGAGELCNEGRCSGALVCGASTGRCAESGPAVCTDDPL